MNRGIFVGFFTGIILTVGWVIFIDAQIVSHDKFIATHILPPLFSTAAAVCINLVSIDNVAESIPTKIWLFVWVTVQCICIGASVFILSTDYPIEAPYPGVAILLQTILCMVATFLFFVGK